MVSRADRVRKALIREVSDLLRRDVKDPRIAGIVSVTDVELSTDCRHAKIFVSVYGDQEAQDSTMLALASCTGFIRSEIGKRINLRFAPEIVFKIDHSLERGSRVSLILDKISRGEI